LTGQSRFPSLSSLNLRSFSQLVARLDHYVQARFRNRFGREARQLARFIPEGGVAFDVGANHGKYSKNFARARNGSCRVYCFEPLEYNYTLLEMVVRPYPNVKVLRLALSDSAGEAELYVPVRPSKRISPGSAHLGDEACEVDFGTATAHDVYRETVVTDTIDRVMEREGIDRLDFMKIDVQGAEALVLRGGRKALEAHKPAIFCELSPGWPECLGLTVEDTARLLDELGYRPHLLDERTGRIEGCTVDRQVRRDYLFLHPDRMDAAG
jgi:FkbM family methyltransferase